MTMQSILDGTAEFLKHLGLGEEPFGIYYADAKPDNAYGPKQAQFRMGSDRERLGMCRCVAWE